MYPILIAVALFAAYQFYKKRFGSTSAATTDKSLFNPKTLIVVLNGGSVCAGLVYLLTINSVARFLCIVSAILASIFVIYANYGLPNVSRNAIRQPMREYFSKCMSGAEFPFLFFALMFTNDITTQQLGLIPFGLADYLSALLVIRRSVWFLGSHGTAAWRGIAVWDRFFQPIWTRLSANSTSIIELSGLVEILLGFWMIVLVLTPARQLMTTFVYWNFLRIRFMAPRSRATHVAAWAKLDARTRNLQQSVPVLARPIAFMKNWFHPQVPQA
jgi:hypothetical protein